MTLDHRISVAIAASGVQNRARRGEYGADSADVGMLARAAMALGPKAAARVGATLLRAALQASPEIIADSTVLADLESLDDAVRFLVEPA